MIKSRCSNLLSKAVLLSVFLSPGYVISNVHADTAYSISGIEQVTGKLTGRVVDAKGDPIPGANIAVKGTTIGTITDMDGNFSINVNPNQILTISFIGYETKTIPVSNQKTLNVVLKENVNELDELVVVSYGTQKKRDLTGSVSKIDADKLGDLPVGQFAQKLQGQVAGLQINQSTGQPGQGMAFRIRGAASINGGSEPLFVVDGMPISTGINNISPDEIETFSVLKDAAATSLYGSRAANGVILITTKRGKQGRTEVAFNANYGIQTLKGTKRMDVMNAREFATFQKEYLEDAGREIPEAYNDLSKYGEGTDWYGLLTEDAPTQNYSLNISASKDKLSSSITLGYFNQQGVVRNSGFERFSLRANNDFQVNDRIKIGLNIAPVLQLFNNQNTDGDRQIISGAFITDPCISPYDENGNLTTSLVSPSPLPFKWPNWIRALEEKTNDYKVLTLLSNAFLEADIWNGIKYKFQAGIDLGARNQRTFTPSTAGGGMGTPPPVKADGNYNSEFYYNWTIENMLMYDKTFGEHTVGALIGYTAQKYRKEWGNLSGTDFPDDDIQWIDAAATKNGGSGVTEWALASMIGRINYSFKDRYLLQATFRRDGCSRFGAGNKYANFPSVSAGWIASDETFMKPIVPIMNYLKIRASYGLTGNYNLGSDYRHLANIGKADYVLGGTLAPGKAMSNIGNNLLTWEETKQLDLGIDMGFLNDRIYLIYDFYKKKVDGLLYQIDIPYSAGFGNIYSNIGDYKSWGHEITIQSRNFVGDFKWTTNLNLSFNRNEITRLGTNDTPMGGYGDQQDWNRLQVGEPIGVFMGYIFDGVYMTEAEFQSQPKHASSEVGTVRMKDISGPNGTPDGVIDTYDRTIIGNPNPDMLFGLTNEFFWKNFDLSILLTGQIGGDIMDASRENTLNLDGVFNVLKEVKDRWRSPENPGNGLIPKTKSGTTELYRFNHSGWVYDATYLTIKNITLGYTVPIPQNRYISKLRFYVTGQQLHTFTKYPGMNPEISNNNNLSWNGLGVDRTNYPVPKSFSLGCNITF